MKRTSIGHRIFLLCLGFLLSYVCNVIAQVTEGDALTEISLGASTAYTWGKGYPQSCVCAETNVASNLCDQFKCKCTCDKTAGKCDYSCCCDPDCTSDQISRFQALDACLPEGGTPDTEKMCYNTQELEKVNPRSPLGGESAAARAVGEVLCVTKTNHYRLGEYFDDVKPYAGANVFQTSVGQKAFSYHPVSTVYETDSIYDQNDTIPVYNDAAATQSLGSFPLPSVDFSGTCNDKSLGLFENPTADRGQISGRSLWEHEIGASQECTRVFSTDVTTFDAQCTQSQSLAKYVTSLYVAKKSDSTVLDGSNTVLVTLGTVLFQDSITGIISNITDNFASNACSTTSVADTSYTSGTCVFNSGSTITSMTAGASGTEQVCRNVVKSVAYEVQNSQDSTYSISYATANVVLTDVSTKTGYTNVRQSFSLDFFDNGDTPMESEGNLVTRPRSGNPGYLMGAPIVFGKAGTTDGTIDAYVGGFKIPSPIALFASSDQSMASSDPPSTCPTSTQVPGSVQVPFGYDISTGCTLSLTRSELEALCCEGSSGCSGDSAFSDSTGLPYFYNTGVSSTTLSYLLNGYVGLFGNADPLDITQWLDITVEDPTTAAGSKTWNSATGTCANMYSQMNIEFLVAKTGEKLVPQNKIVAASIKYATSDWKTSAVVGDSVTTQNFNLGVTVSFVFTAHNEIIGYVPPPPPVLFKVPYDVFYPFVLSSPAPKTASISMMVLSLPVVLMMVLFIFNY